VSLGVFSILKVVTVAGFGMNFVYVLYHNSRICEKFTSHPYICTFTPTSQFIFFFLILSLLLLPIDFTPTKDFKPDHFEIEFWN
jgi:hypothetical protein